MKVRLNLATSPLVSNRRFTLGTTVIGGLALVLVIFLTQRAYSTWSLDKTFRARQDILEKQVTTLQKQRQSLSAFFEDGETVKRRPAFLPLAEKQRRLEATQPPRCHGEAANSVLQPPPVAPRAKRTSCRSERSSASAPGSCEPGR